MRDLSLHLLDLAQNSISAGAATVTIRIGIDENGWLKMTLEDDGKGMSPELLRLMLTNPLTPDFVFEGKTPKGECSFDTREVRKVLGSDIPLNEPSVASWLQDALKEEIDPIFGGV